MPPAPSCRHGKKVYITKLNANTGEPWHAWGCPGPQNGDKCSREENSMEFHNPPTN